MRILVYPHTMEVGGSQTNAIELAAAVRDRGHEVMVYADHGVLVERVRELGLEHLPRRQSRRRPGLATAADLRRIARHRGVDVIHGYEWPPILEAYAATRGLRGTVSTGTVMSMAVAPFVPSSLPLVVGTAAIRAETSPLRRGPVHLIEPPIDTRANSPQVCPAPPAAVSGLDPASLRIVVVSRLVPELKLEGILTAIEGVGVLAERRPVQLVIVGDGVSRETVSEAARKVNDRHGRAVVVLAGEWLDPRWAYAMADICLGTGGSALKAMAFGKPLVVHGADGFFELVTDRTLPGFLHQGWYGYGGGREEGLASFLGAVEPILSDPDRRGDLGDLGRRLVVSRFSLDAAAQTQEDIYRQALEAPEHVTRWLLDGARSGRGLIRYKVERRLARRRGRLTRDDFNARTR